MRQGRRRAGRGGKGSAGLAPCPPREHGDLQSEDNQGCPHCFLHRPNGARAAAERKASGREEGTEIQRALLEVTALLSVPADPRRLGENSK